MIDGQFRKIPVSQVLRGWSRKNLEPSELIGVNRRAFASVARVPPAKLGERVYIGIIGR